MSNIYFMPSEGPLVAYGRLHIGKNSGTTEFHFQAYEEEGRKRRVEIGFEGLTLEIDVPRLVAKSWADWKELLRATPGIIENEYGISYTVEDFEKEVTEYGPGKKPDGYALENSYDRLVANAHRYGKVDPDQHWKDAEGFAFSKGTWF